MQAQLNNVKNITSKTGDGIDLLYSSPVLSKLISGNNITINRIIHARQPDDGQVKFNVELSNYYTTGQITSLLHGYYNISSIGTLLLG